MADGKLQQKLTEMVEDAHAMEQAIQRMLESMISETSASGVRTELELHRHETIEHEERLRRRLEVLGEDPTMVRQRSGALRVMIRRLLRAGRRGNPLRNARDTFATAHRAIAVYEVLERVARRAGDRATMEVARRNRRGEEHMARRIAGSWDKVVELSV